MKNTFHSLWLSLTTWYRLLNTLRLSRSHRFKPKNVSSSFHKRVRLSHYCNINTHSVQFGKNVSKLWSNQLSDTDMRQGDKSRNSMKTVIWQHKVSRNSTYVSAQAQNFNSATHHATHHSTDPLGSVGRHAKPASCDKQQQNTRILKDAENRPASKTFSRNSLMLGAPRYSTSFLQAKHNNDCIIDKNICSKKNTSHICATRHSPLSWQKTQQQMIFRFSFT